MGLLDQLSANKGTVSSALGKALAAEALDEGRIDVVMDCIDLASYEAPVVASKHIRAGAAKVVEIVAEARPELVAPHLTKLLPALSVREPQTRWMIIRVMGYCAPLNAAVAREAIPYVQDYLSDKEGLCLASSADLFLGDVGSLSREDAATVFPLLEGSMEALVPNEQDWVLEALYKTYATLDEAQRGRALVFAERWCDFPRKSTQKRARRLLKLAGADR
jgi:hypothetical protein